MIFIDPEKKDRPIGWAKNVNPFQSSTFSLKGLIGTLCCGIGLIGFVFSMLMAGWNPKILNISGGFAFLGIVGIMLVRKADKK